MSRAAGRPAKLLQTKTATEEYRQLPAEALDRGLCHFAPDIASEVSSHPTAAFGPLDQSLPFRNTFARGCVNCLMLCVYVFERGDATRSYEILSPLGAGGMGEVYRARHVKLRREAAIKVLPSEFASDPERLLRFEHEARAASALNHPRSSPSTTSTSTKARSSLPWSWSME